MAQKPLVPGTAIWDFKNMLFTEIKNRIVERGLSQKQTAELLRSSQPTISGMMAKGICPKMETLLEMALILQIPIVVGQQLVGCAQTDSTQLMTYIDEDLQNARADLRRASERVQVGENRRRRLINQGASKP